MAQHKTYFTIGPALDGRILAMVTKGHTQYGDKEVTVLWLEVVPTVAAGKALIEKWRTDEPWLKRH